MASSHKRLSLNDFRKRHKGKYVTGYTSSGRQCVDLARHWIENLTGNPTKGLPAVVAAKDMFAAADPKVWRKVRFEPGKIPPVGALVIFGGTRWGHVAIARAKSSKKTFRTFDQNWPVGSPCADLEHPAKASGAYHIIGWLIKRRRK